MKINIKDIIWENIYSRSNGNKLRLLINNDKKEDHIIFDFSGVKFISRGFADELRAIESENHNISIENMNDLWVQCYAL